MRVCEEEKHFAKSKLLIQLLNTPKLKRENFYKRKNEKGKRNKKLEMRKRKKEKVHSAQL